MSKGEELIQSILISNKCEYIREVAFPDLKYKGSLLRYDFYFTYKDKKYLLEFDGIQHFEKVPFFAKGNFLHMKENDRRKNKYALKINIPLIRIPYWDIDKVKTIEDLFQDKYLVTSIYHNDRLINQ